MTIDPRRNEEDKVCPECGRKYRLIRMGSRRCLLLPLLRHGDTSQQSHVTAHVTGLAQRPDKHQSIRHNNDTEGRLCIG